MAYFCACFNIALPEQQSMKLFFGSILFALQFHIVFCLRVPALFIFGASFVDAGNNNILACASARANFHPYGINFPGQVATGRFSDGFLITDYIALHLGLPLIPPFRSHPQNLESGVNFAGAGSGLYNTTGTILHCNDLNYPLPLAAQVRDFQQVKQRLSAQKGTASASRIINDSIFLIAIGENDLASEYFRKEQLQKEYTVSEFIEMLVSIYRSQIQKLYEEGARKFVVVSERPFGCTPIWLTVSNTSKPGECYATVNKAMEEFNGKLEAMVQSLRVSLAPSLILFADAYGPSYDMFQNPSAYGFEVANMPCCTLTEVHTCEQGGKTCIDPSTYLFWDSVHFTSRANKILANLFWYGSTQFIYPTNIKELAQYSFQHPSY